MILGCGRASSRMCRPFVYIGNVAFYLESPQSVRIARQALIRSRSDRAMILRGCYRCFTDRHALNDKPAYLLAHPRGALVSLRRGDGLRYLCSPETAQSFVFLYGLERLVEILKNHALPPWTWYRTNMGIIAAADSTLAEGYYLTLGEP